MTRLNVLASEDAVWAQRLLQFAHAVTEDRLLQVAVAVAVASLWFSLAFGDPRFLVLLAAAGVAVRRFHQLERDFVPEDDDLL
jgi:L-asparagine transporter-like permease